jgi:septal ring factor EnvC (AmiA/AmiB activator)
VRGKVQAATTSIAAVTTRLTQLANTKDALLSKIEPLIEKTTESQRLAEEIQQQIAPMRQRLQQNSDNAKYYDLLQTDLDQATRIYNQFQVVVQQWEMARAQSKATFAEKWRQLKMFSDELDQAKEKLNKLVTVGPSLSDMEGTRDARWTIAKTALLTNLMNEVKAANANWTVQKERVASELGAEIDRLHQAQSRLISTAERYAESYRSVRSIVLHSRQLDLELSTALTK